MRCKKETKRTKEVDKPVFSFLLIGFPTFLIIFLGVFLQEGTLWVQILVACYQFIILKQFIDQYYKILA